MAKPFESQVEEIKAMKHVDNMLQKVVKPEYIMPIVGGEGIAVNAGYYEDPTVIPLDEKMQYSKVLGMGQGEPRVTLDLTKEDIDVMKSKADVAMLRDFDTWVVTQLGASGLTAEEKRQWLKEIYPQFLERMEKACHYVIENEHKYKKMQLTNPQSLEDMVWMYFFEKYAMLDGSNFDFMDILNGVYPKAGANAANNTERQARMAFERGLFNSKKRFMDYMIEFYMNRPWAEQAAPGGPREFNPPNTGDMLRGWAMPGHGRKNYPSWGYTSDPIQGLTTGRRAVIRGLYTPEGRAAIGEEQYGRLEEAKQIFRQSGARFAND